MGWTKGSQGIWKMDGGPLRGLSSGAHFFKKGRGASVGSRLLGGGGVSLSGGRARAPRVRGRGRVYGAWQSLKWAGP